MASSTSYRICLCFRRRFEGASNEPPEAIKEVFDRYADNGVMGPDQLRRFLMEEQGEDEASAAAAAAAAAAEGHHLGGMFHARKGGLSLDAFFQYLFREDNHPLVSHSLQVHQDMRAPLSHYFIYTGHNSYLTGNQLSSDCSDVPIIEALEKGVRVIELDLWPNSGKDDVHVLHGRTLTAPVDLLKCLESIKEHAFSASPYPVILTLEDHLTPNLQAKVAQMLTQVFGKMLYRPDSECSPKALACPEDLKMRVVVSTKPPKEYLESKVPTVDTGAQEHKDSVSSPDKKVLWGKEVSDLKLKLSGDSPNKGDTIDEDGEAIDQYEEEDADEVEDADESQAQTEAVEYKNLIAIKATKRKRNLSETLKVEPGVATRISLSEQMFEKATKSHGTELIRFTQQNLLRIFPKSTRFDSSNYNPFLGWMYGAQMVAFNMQSHGRDLWLMEGMFRANGGCGYVKKPDMLLKGSECDMVLDPKIELQVKMTLKVKVYMGDGWRMDFHRTHFDTFSPPDFYARVGIAGVPGDCVMKRTKAVEDSWRPVWGEEFEFPLTVPELAVMRIEVHEYDISDKDDFGGQTCLPFWELRPGIRTVQLHDHRGHKYNNVRLLMRFHFS